jgi:hypothetical protein
MVVVGASSSLLPSASRQTGRARVAAIAFMIIGSVLLIHSEYSKHTTSLFEYEHEGGHSGDWKGTTDPADLTDDQVVFKQFRPQICASLNVKEVNFCRSRMSGLMLIMHGRTLMRSSQLPQNLGRIKMIQLVSILKKKLGLNG